MQHILKNYLQVCCGLTKSFVFLILLFGISETAFALNYYVATTGNDSYTTTQAQNASTPWKTIQKAADIVPVGSTVHVAAGTYSGTLNITRGGTSEATRIRFVSDTKWGAKILGNPTGTVGSYGSDGAVWIKSSSYITIEGFDISTVSQPPTYYNGVTITGGSLVGSSYVVIKGNYIHDIKTLDDHGLGVSDDYYYYNASNQAKNQFNQITGNFITRTDGYGVYISTYKPTVTNNLIVNVGRFGVHAWHGANGETVTNNTIINVHKGVNVGSGHEHQESIGMTFGAGDEPFSGVSGAPPNDNILVENNIIIGTDQGGIAENCNGNEICIGTNNVFRNNLFYKAGTSSSQNYINMRNGNTGTGSLNADPKLVSALDPSVIGYHTNETGNGNYHLTSISPAINTGIIAGAPTNDFGGNVRSGNPDIGAYEFINACTPGVGDNFPNTSFTNQTGTFTVNFDVLPTGNNVDGFIGLSNGPATDWVNLASIIRFDNLGKITARDGTVYSAASSIPYSINTQYHVKMVIYISTKKYNIYVTPAGGSQITVGTNYNFRDSQSGVTQLNNWSKVTNTACFLNVTNFTVGAGAL